MKSSDLSLMAFLCTFSLLLNAQHTITFSVDFSSEPSVSDPGIRGSLPPLSWEKTWPLADEDGDGIYQATVEFPDPRPAGFLTYKYVYGDVVWELDEAGDRILLLSEPSPKVPVETWDQPRSITGLDEWRIPSEQLQKDFEIVKQAYTQLHPGLYRYNDEAAIQQHFQNLKRSLGDDLTLREAYLAFSKFLGQIRCGHTYANFFNQNGLVKQVLLGQPDKLPFAHRIVDRRLIITRNGSDEERLKRGVEVLAVNGVPVAQILDSLLLVVKSDGANDAKRLYDLQVQGYDTYEAFDVYFPLFFPPRDGKYDLRVRDLSSGEAFQTSVAAVTREQRKARLEERYGPLPASYDDLWSFRLLDGKTAYLQLGTFVVWNMEMDWKAFLKNAFREAEKKGADHLIIDLRGNEGGADEVLDELAKYIVPEEFSYQGWQDRLRFNRVPEDLRPYLDTWDNSVYDQSEALRPVGDGFYTWKEAGTGPTGIKAGKKAFAGELYFLVDAANSSATFLLADYVRKGNLGTLVGQPTGGNRRGINGGFTLFLRLPHSKVELDIPLIGFYPTTEQPDAGIEPDVIVEPKVEDVVRGVDTELEAVLELIRGRK